MRYKHKTPEYVPDEGTNNNHHLIWSAIKAVIDAKGTIADWHLDSLSMKLGEGANKGNTKYAEYLIRNEYLTEVNLKIIKPTELPQ